jgi:uncharacterized protein (TIGR02147 family)
VKSIFDYSDYRLYLQDYYAWAKTAKKGFSHRYFLQKAGMSGPTYLKRVMEGQHDLTEKSIPKFALALELNQAESEFFGHLVHFNQARTLDEKDAHFQSLMALKSPHAQHTLEKAQYDYYRDWYNVAIREMLATVSFNGSNYRDLAKRLAPAILPKKVKRAIALLEELGLIRKGPDGLYRAETAFVMTDPGIQSLLIPKYHQTMARLAEEAVARFSKQERFFNGTTVSLSESTYHHVTEVILKTQQEILKLVGEDSSPDRVYHLNMQLFPLTSPAPRRGRRKK